MQPEACLDTSPGTRGGSRGGGGKKLEDRGIAMYPKKALRLAACLSRGVDELNWGVVSLS